MLFCNILQIDALIFVQYLVVIFTLFGRLRLCFVALSLVALCALVLHSIRLRGLALSLALWRVLKALRAIRVNAACDHVREAQAQCGLQPQLKIGKELVNRVK